MSWCDVCDGGGFGGLRESRIPFQRRSQPLMEECDGVEMWHELEMEVVNRKGRREYRGEEKNKDYIV